MITPSEYKQMRRVCKIESRYNEHWEDFAQDYAVKILEGHTVSYCYQFVWRSYQKRIYNLLGGSTELLPMISDDKEISENYEYTELQKNVMKIATTNRKRLHTDTLSYFELFSKEYSYSEIGKEFGVSKQLVGHSLKKLFNLCKDQIERPE